MERPSGVEPGILHSLRAVRPPSVGFVAAGAALLAVVASVVNGLEGTNDDSGSALRVGQWAATNFLAAATVVIVVAAGRRFISDGLYSRPAWVQGLVSYSLFTIAGIIGRHRAAWPHAGIRDRL